MEIEQFIKNNFNYNLDYDLDKLRKSYKFEGRCKKSVPQAIYIFLISNSFEDAVRKAISIGGDTDTIGCMVGSISEAYYGIPEELQIEAKRLLPPEFKEIIEEGYSKVSKK